MESALPGDVIFNILIQKDKDFRRDGMDLHTKLEISFEEAILGFEKDIKHLDDRIIKVMKAGTSNCNEKVRILGEGMKVNGASGDLYVEIIYSLPNRINLK